MEADRNLDGRYLETLADLGSMKTSGGGDVAPRSGEKGVASAETKTDGSRATVASGHRTKRFERRPDVGCAAFDVNPPSAIERASSALFGARQRAGIDAPKQVRSDGQ